MPPFRVQYQSARRYHNDNVLTASPAFETALTVASPFGVPVFMPNEVRETADVVIGEYNHVSPFASISPIRTTSGDVRFPSKTGTTISTIAGFTINIDAI
tara:strand:+ start:7212 stop:7511 length:300 start_codon:yes stop_codon:yes gene_type:complete